MMATFNDERNSQVLLALRAAGANFELLHRIDHVFVGSHEKLCDLESQLTCLGLGIDYHEPHLLIAMEWMNLEIDQINERTEAFAELAARYSCQYDGWGTAPRRGETSDAASTRTQ